MSMNELNESRDRLQDDYEMLLMVQKQIKVAKTLAKLKQMHSQALHESFENKSTMVADDDSSIQLQSIFQQNDDRAMDSSSASVQTSSSHVSFQTSMNQRPARFTASTGKLRQDRSKSPRRKEEKRQQPYFH